MIAKHTKSYLWKDKQQTRRALQLDGKGIRQKSIRSWIRFREQQTKIKTHLGIMNECTMLRTNMTQMKLRNALKKVQKEQKKEMQKQKKKDRSGAKYTENRSQNHDTCPSKNEPTKTVSAENERALYYGSEDVSLR